MLEDLLFDGWTVKWFFNCDIWTNEWYQIVVKFSYLGSYKFCI